MRNRVLTAVVGLAILAAVLVFYETFIFNLVFMAACLIAVHEIYAAFQLGEKTLPIYIAFAVMIAIVMFSDNEIGYAILKPAAFLFGIFLVLYLIVRVQTLRFEKLSGMLVFSAIVVFCFYSPVLLKSLLPRVSYGYDAVYFVLLILGFAWGGDTVAFFVGSAFGKHKLAPQVSPKKTVEGAVGGVIGSMLVGILFTFIYIEVFQQDLPMSGDIKTSYYFIIAILGAVASVLGMLGDLFASAVKRQCGIKDYGTIFPGHGGVLDRFDSVMFVAPLVVVVVRLAFYHFMI